MAEQVSQQVRVVEAQPLWKRHMGKLLIVSLAFNVFAFLNLDSSSRGYLLLFAIGAISVYVVGEIVRSLLLPTEMLRIGEQHIVPAAQKYFRAFVTMADCFDKRQVGSTLFLYEYRIPGDGRVITFVWDRTFSNNKGGIVGKIPKPISILVEEFNKNALLKGVIERSGNSNLAEVLENNGVFISGIGGMT